MPAVRYRRPQGFHAPNPPAHPTKEQRNITSNETTLGSRRFFLAEKPSIRRPSRITPQSAAANRAIRIKNKIPNLVEKGLISKELAENLLKELDDILHKYRNGILSDDEAIRFLHSARQFLAKHSTRK